MTTGIIGFRLPLLHLSWIQLRGDIGGVYCVMLLDISPLVGHHKSCVIVITRSCTFATTARIHKRFSLTAHECCYT